MTFTNQSNRTSATGSGAVGQEIPFLFPISDASDLTVYKRVTATGVQTNLDETTNYTITISGDAGGTVTTVTAIETTEQIHIVRTTPYTQNLDLVAGGSFNAENVEDSFDKNTKLSIQQKDKTDRTPRFPETDPVTSIGNLPSSIDRASKTAGYDSTGKPNASVEVASGSVSFTTIGTDIAEAADADAAMILLNGIAVFNVTNATYGAVGDGDGSGGGTDDSTAIQAAITAAETALGIVWIPPGAIYRIDTGLTIDVGKASLWSSGAILDASSMTADYALSVYSSRTYPANYKYNVSRSIKGITLMSDQTTGVHGIKVGHATYTRHNEINFENVSVFDFDRALEFIDYSWGITFRNCAFRNADTYHLYYPTGLTGSGETFSFFECIFTDGAGVIHIGGAANFEFHSCSILGTPLNVSSDAHITLLGGVLESPDYTGTGYRYVDVSGTSAEVILNGTKVILGEPTGNNWEMAPFTNDVTGTGGLVLNGVHLPLPVGIDDGWFLPETTDDQKVWVTGTGRTIVNSVFSFASFTAYNYAAICAANNLIRNGDFEAATISPWKANAYGNDRATATISTTAKRKGTNGLLISNAAGAGINVWQAFYVQPGVVYIAGGWGYRVNDVGVTSILLRFYDANNNELSSTLGTIPITVDVTWAYKSAVAKAPAETVYAKVEITAPAGQSVYWDDIIVNAMSSVDAIPYPYWTNLEPDINEGDFVLASGKMGKIVCNENRTVCNEDTVIVN